MNYALLEPKVVRHLRPSLNHYFDFRETDACFQMLHHIQTFISHICSEYDLTILKLVENRVANKTVADWVSWYTEMFVQIQASTLSKFSDLVVHNESFNLTISNRIPCTVASRYIRKIGSCYKAAYEEYIVLMGLEPISNKHIRKRKAQPWKPYMAEFIPCGCIE
jgi:hypothetical protein